jgi:PAS domain S-box-containing protein
MAGDETRAPDEAAGGLGEGRSLLEDSRGRRPSDQLPAGPAVAADDARPTLAQALREMETIFENALVGMVLARDNRFVKINARGAELLGRPAESLLGNTAEVLFDSPETYQAFVAQAYADMGRHGAHVGEHQFLRPDGKRLTLRTAARQISPGNAAEGVIWAFDDITDQKRLAEELLASKRAAEAASRAKTQFLANISHELRTPLNGILGIAQLLLDKGGDEETREYLSVIRQSAATVTNIVGELLDLSNVEAGRLRLAPREFELAAELTPLLRNFMAQSLPRSFEFSYLFDPGLPERIVGDANRIKQILINLVGNAFKYTRRGHVTARVAPADGAGQASQGFAGPEGRTRLRLVVEDTGIGIEPGREQAIFEPFGIGEDYLTKKYSGAGLGLAIARKLARMMGGDVTFVSEPGRGSTFTATLECGLPRPVQKPRRPRPPRRGEAGEGPAASGGGLRILLAEDEPVNRIFTVRALQKLGHAVEAAADGREALAMLERGSYDLVLMDIQMPRLNGLEATRRIRSGQVEGVSPTMPVVALTAYAMEGDRQKGLEAGMDEYVTKPFEPAELTAAMERALAK